jgi:hypothetical protein
MSKKLQPKQFMLKYPHSNQKPSRLNFQVNKTTKKRANNKNWPLYFNNSMFLILELPLKISLLLNSRRMMTLTSTSISSMLQPISELETIKFTNALTKRPR